jgi:transposase-like protein
LGTEAAVVASGMAVQDAPFFENQTQVPGLVMTIAEVAREFGKSESTIRSWVARREIQVWHDRTKKRWESGRGPLGEITLGELLEQYRDLEVPRMARRVTPTRSAMLAAAGRLQKKPVLPIGAESVRAASTPSHCTCLRHGRSDKERGVLVSEKQRHEELVSAVFLRVSRAAAAFRKATGQDLKTFRVSAEEWAALAGHPHDEEPLRDLTVNGPHAPVRLTVRA